MSFAIFINEVSANNTPWVSFNSIMLIFYESFFVSVSILEAVTNNDVRVLLVFVLVEVRYIQLDAK